LKKVGKRRIRVSRKKPRPEQLNRNRLLKTDVRGNTDERNKREDRSEKTSVKQVQKTIVKGKQETSCPKQERKKWTDSYDEGEKKKEVISK